MGLFKFSIFLFLAFNSCIIHCDNKGNIRKRREIAKIRRINELNARRNFAISYKQLQKDVYHLKRKILKKKPIYEEKLRIIQPGIYGYIDIPDLVKYIQSGRSGGTDTYVLTPKDSNKISEFTPILVGGVVFDINFSKYSGLSIILGYSIFRETQDTKPVSFRSGYSGMLLFKLSNIPSPINIITNFLPNLLDPIYWILWATGLYFKVEILAGLHFSLYSNVKPGKFSFGVRDNSFKNIGNFIETRSQRTPCENILRLFNEFTYYERRVYVCKHLFYSFNTLLLIPIVINWLQSDCRNTANWLKKNYLKFFLNITLGIVI